MVKEVVKPNVDGDARWIKKMGKLHFGYKRHTVTDENGLILAEETTAANESDIKHLETPLQKANLPVRTPVYADKGYNSSENKEVLTRMKLKSRIMHKGVRGKKITEREQRINVTPVRDKDLLRKVPISYSFQCARAVPLAYSRRNSMQPMPHRDS